MKKVTGYLKAYWLISLGLLIYLLFFISVAWTGWFDVFFSGAALHIGAKGIDFYQIPRGAWAFWHGGSLTGVALPDGARYAKQEFANDNVYHPLLTLALGSFLMQFDPAMSPYVWLWTKLGLSLLVIAYFYWNFRQSKYIQLAVFIMLVNFSVYLELAAWQFQFVLNIFLLIFLVAVIKKRSLVWSGLNYWLGLLVKPIGILFTPLLLLKRRWLVALVGIGLFAVNTWALAGPGRYYTDNLVANLSSSGYLGPNQIITFNALLHYSTHWADLVYTLIQDGTFALAILLGLFRRTHLSKGVFLLVAYYLCFYNMVFEYQWSTLAYVIAVCVVCCPEFQTKLARFFILLICLPDCFFIFNRLHIDVKDLGYLGLIPGATAWQWMVISKLLPLFLLSASVLAGDIRPILRDLKAFWRGVRKINEQLEVFGEKEATCSYYHPGPWRRPPAERRTDHRGREHPGARSQAFERRGLRGPDSAHLHATGL